LSNDLPSEDGELPDIVSQEAEGAQQISGLVMKTGGEQLGTPGRGVGCVRSIRM
jgi:hypothetical protein